MNLQQLSSLPLLIRQQQQQSQQQQQQQQQRHCRYYYYCSLDNTSSSSYSNKKKLRSFCHCYYYFSIWMIATVYILSTTTNFCRAAARSFCSSTSTRGGQALRSVLFAAATTTTTTSRIVVLAESVLLQQQQQQQLLLLLKSVRGSTTTATTTRSLAFIRPGKTSSSSTSNSSGTTKNSGRSYLSKKNTSGNNHQRQRYQSISSSILSRTMSSSSTTENTSYTNTILKVAMCQFHVTDNKELNIQTAESFIDTAVSSNGDRDIIVLPEIWNSPYATAAFPDYAEIVPDQDIVQDDDADTTTTVPKKIDSDISPSSAFLQEKAIQHGIYLIGGSIPEKVNEGGNELYYNTCLVFDPTGRIVAKHRKVHLFDIDVPGGITFKESETLSPGSTISYFTYKNLFNIGIGICYDIRFAEYAMVLTQQYNCTVLIYPGAFNMVTGPAHWELLQRARANDNQCYIITASPARIVLPSDAPPKTKYPHYTAWGHSSVVNPWGEVIATTDEKPAVVTAELDLSKISSVRQSIPITLQKRNDLYELNTKTTK